MDEPFGALDAQTREVMHDLILHVLRLEQATIVFVTHDVEEAIYLGQRVVVLGAASRANRQHLRRAAAGAAHSGHEALPEFLPLKREIVARIRETSGMKTDLELLES